MRLRKKSGSTEQSRKKASQDWLPFQDVAGSLIWGRDGALAAVLRVEPINIALKSENETKRIITALHEALNGQQESIQIFCLPRSVDLDAYLQSLQQAARETGATAKRRILTEYVHYVASVVRGGEAGELRFYLVVSHKGGRQAKEEVIQRAFELAANISKSLRISVCDDAAILDMLFSFLQPAQAAFEPVPAGSSVSTLYRG